MTACFTAFGLHLGDQIWRRDDTIDRYHVSIMILLWHKLTIIITTADTTNEMLKSAKANKLSVYKVFSRNFILDSL